MAGSYSDVPGRRMAWDADGSRAFLCFAVGGGPNATSLNFELNGTQKAAANSQDLTAAMPTQGGAGSQHELFVIFPELREIDGMYCRLGGSANGTVGMFATAANAATNPFTGWTQKVAAGSTPDLNDNDQAIDSYRTNIVSMAETTERGAAAVFVVGSTATAPRNLHIYGVMSPGQTPDKLLWIDDATGLEFTAPIDYGNVPRGGSEDRALRLRNDSATLQANTIQYTAQNLGVDSATQGGGGADWFTSTLPGGSTFSATQSVGSLAAATTSGIITVRRITAATEFPRVFAPRLRVVVDSWT